MISIEEKICHKLPGLTSLFVNFPYNENIKDIVSIIKTFNPVNYVKKTYTWEIPLTYLSTLLDSVCTYDNIELKLLEDDTQKNVTYNLSQYKN